MPELPASARMALWATCYLSGRVDLETAVARATPDADHAQGARTWLETWHSLGERVVLVALPRPGDYGDLPGGGALRDAALAAGECVFVPGLGGGLVPVVEGYGPPGDRGLAVRWTHYDSDPVPPHRLDAWALRETQAELNDAVASATGSLEGGPTPWASRGLAEEAGARLDSPSWGLPSGLLPRAARLIATAGAIGDLARFAQSTPTDGTGAAGIERRSRALRELSAAADQALSRAVDIAALHLAGLRPGRAD